ncbi:endoglucanase [Brachybacterium ginsengisoli]|uniref:Endoglucanase n=1 Tax=Brachybacterium ginsengisoli TaxID=1331682 RepID=A0A291H109_9MICO|nr:cellulase family glycosylhydrolase [Brachybacterium ginsengisoli]ATG56168.1 endoglucanase [Brachybacterium ginsengisoli]
MTIDEAATAAAAPTPGPVPADPSQRFHRREGDRLVAPEGALAFRRGMGLGGWLLPEGYMWDLPTPVDSPRRIEQLVLDMVGEASAAEFWTEYRRRFITAGDIAAIAAAGFDHVRLPLNSRVIFDGRDLLADGIAHVDDTIAWCREAGISCVLDLHGAPGGQTGENIDDSPRRLPELFTDPDAYAQGLRLWRLLAERYADEPVVSAYDLLNEPLPEKRSELVPRLADFYRDAIAEIRAVDPHHLLSVEGWNWATRFEGIDRVWDENSCLHFHKYWSETTTESLRGVLELRERLGLPLWMGESGENEDGWYAAAFGLFEQHEIPWTFWTWKKIDRPTSPIVITPPRRWGEVIDHAAGRGPVPPRAQEILAELLDALPLAACTIRGGALDALPGISSRGPSTVGSQDPADRQNPTDPQHPTDQEGAER